MSVLTATRSPCKSQVDTLDEKTDDVPFLKISCAQDSDALLAARASDQSSALRAGCAGSTLPGGKSDPELSTASSEATKVRVLAYQPCHHISLGCQPRTFAVAISPRHQPWPAVATSRGHQPLAFATSRGHQL